MKEILNLMIYIFNLKGIDFMGYKVTKNNPYTYHHIKKKCHGGLVTLNNGAILTKYAHTYLHIIESRDLLLYEYINNILKQINEQRSAPSKEQLMAIDYALLTFEKEHAADKTSKGKILIRKEFLNRG